MSTLASSIYIIPMSRISAFTIVCRSLSGIGRSAERASACICLVRAFDPENRLLIVINKVVVLLIAAFNQLDHTDFKAHEIKAGIQ